MTKQRLDELAEMYDDLVELQVLRDQGEMLSNEPNFRSAEVGVDGTTFNSPKLAISFGKLVSDWAKLNYNLLKEEFDNA